MAKKTKDKMIKIKCKHCGDIHMHIEITGKFKASWICERCRQENNVVLTAKNFEK